MWTILIVIICVALIPILLPAQYPIIYILRMIIKEKVCKYLGIGLKIRDSDATITYFDGMKKFTVLFPKKRCVNNIYYIAGFDKNNIHCSITTKILKLAGPFLNFHGIETTPKMLGFNNIIITYIDSKTIKFSEDEKIQLIV